MLSCHLRIVIISFLLNLTLFGFGQSAPSRISYQAVVRDIAGNELVNEAVTIEIAIHVNTPDGQIVFEENHDLIATNQFGLFSLMIGDGIPTGNGVYAVLNQIPWGDGLYFLEVRAAIPGQGTTQIIGVSQLLTVPYAYFAERAATVITESDGDTQNELIDDFALNGTVLTITENNADYSVDLSGLAGGGDTDNDPQNETITDMTISNSNELVITEAGVNSTADLSSIAYATWNENGNSVYNTSQQVGIGTASPQSTLDVNGSVAMAVATLSDGLYDLASDPALASKVIFICNVENEDVTIELMSAASCPGRIYKFRKFFTSAVTSNDVNITAISGEYVDGQSIYGMNSIYAEYLTIISDGSNWYIIDHSHE